MTEPQQISVMIAEDHPLYLKGLRNLVTSDPDLRVIGETDNGDTIVAAALDLQPDLILMDLQLPGQSGIVATREIMRALPNTRILVITLFADDDSVFSALRAGARGYILKDAEEQEILLAIRAVANGDSLFSPSIANRVLSFFASPRPAAPDIYPTLTERERDILHLLTRGKANMQIAHELHLSPKTIANNLTSIYSKLQVADRQEAISQARKAGMNE
ncbi:MAG TPA: response regulator transcription factor [Thermomicrobiales bacterium]|nr:response regulator transcription factor [Thermomicrobiales bacterium]